MNSIIKALILCLLFFCTTQSLAEHFTSGYQAGYDLTLSIRDGSCRTLAQQQAGSSLAKCTFAGAYTATSTPYPEMDGYWIIKDAFNAIYDTVYYHVGCPDGYTTNGNLCEPVPDDDDCIAKGNQPITTKLKGPNEPMRICIGGCTVEFDQCQYEKIQYSDPLFESPSCKIDNLGDIYCTSLHKPVGAASTSSDMQGTDEPATGETSTGGEKSTTSSSSAPIEQADTPLAGDTTTTQTTTETTNYNDSVSVTSTESHTNVETLHGGDTTKTTTTTTTTHSDGSTTETTDVTYEQTEMIQTTDHMNWTNNTSGTTSSTTPSSSSSSSSTTTTGTDGSSSTTTTGDSGSDDRLGSEEDGDGFGDFIDTGSGDALYTPNEEISFNNSIQNFKDSVFQSSVVTSIDGFFDVSISGSCPVWTIPAVWVFPAISIDMQCSAVMNDIWPYISAVILLCASFLAFRWAVL